MATGEVATSENLGGAEMHSYVSGVSDYLAENEEHAVYLARQIVEHLNYQKEEELPLSYYGRVEEPIYDPGIFSC